MNLALGILALTLIGADGPPAPAPDAPHLRFEVRMLEMADLGWRESCYFQMKPVARQGAVSVWTASRKTAQTLRKHSDSDDSAPRIVTSPDSPATINSVETVNFVGGLRRVANGPVHQASSVAFKPDIEQVRVGYQAMLVGRERPEGLLTRVDLEDTRINSIHTVQLTEMYRDKDGEVDGFIRPTLQIPEVISRKVSGEWLIPKDEILVVSLGAYTRPDEDGEDMDVRERLVLIEAEAVPEKDSEIRPTSARTAIEMPAAMPANAHMPIPAMPSRSLPQGRAQDGTLVALPPLPDDHVTPTSLPGSSEPCASPQIPVRREVRRNGGTSDPDSTPVSYNPAPRADLIAPESAPLRVVPIRIPLNGFMTIEIRAAVTPMPAPAQGRGDGK